MSFIRKIADFLLTTYLFIASAALSMVFTTFLLAEEKFRVTALSLFIFFSTLLIYNFHKFSGVFTFLWCG